MQVEIIVKRSGESTGKKYQLTESGKSKKGTYKTFSPSKDNADIPTFSKLYVKVKRG